MEAAKEFKRLMKSQDQSFLKDIEESRLKVSKLKNLAYQTDRPDKGRLNKTQKSQLSDKFASNNGMSNSYGSGKAIQSKEYTKSREDDFEVNGDNSEMISLKHRLLNERENYKDLIIINNNDDELIDDHDISAFENEMKRKKAKSQNNSKFHNKSASACTDDEHLDVEKLNLL